MSRVATLLCAGIAAFGMTACGFTGNLRTNPGFASFRAPATVHDVDREFALSLGPIPLRLATLLSRPFFRDEPWIPDTLSDVRAVRVYAYEVGDGRRVQAHLEDTVDDLTDLGWEPVAAVREDGGLVAVLVMPEDADAVRGVVVMCQEDDELILVNVIGNMKPETLDTVMDELDIELPVIFIGET